MSLPTITVTFRERAETAIARSARGILCIIVKETSASVKTYTSAASIEATRYTAANLAAIKRAFADTAPRKVVVVAKNTAPTTAELDAQMFSWLCSTETAYQSTVSDYVTAYNAKLEHVRQINACIVPTSGGGEDTPDIVGDHHVIVAPHTVTEQGGGSVAMAAFLPRIAAALCACPITESVTYKALPGVESFTAVSVTDKMVYLVKDDEAVRIARGVYADGSKIAVTEAKDIIREDVVLTFKNQFLGKKRNSAANQMLFCSAVLGYLNGLAEQSVINPDGEISVDIDTEAMRDAWEAEGVDVTGLTDAQVRNKPYKSTVFVRARCTILDVIEDLTFVVELD